MDFVARNALESISPANYLATNPELLDTTRAEAGENLVRGFGNWLEDVERTFDGKGPSGTEKFVVGRDVAATPGKVVMRNELVELIQYSPATPTVFAEPILIIPAWIMKYYILDLSASNSLVRYLVSQGHTVFMVSWKNPTAERPRARHGRLLDDSASAPRSMPCRASCRTGRFMRWATVSAARCCRLPPRASPPRVTGGSASVTLLAAQQDFSEPGELSVFISPSQLDMLEAVMSAPACSRANRWAGRSRCCARAICCGRRPSTTICAASAIRRTI